MNTITFSPDFVAGRNRELIIADGTAPEILELLQGAQVPYVALGACDIPLQAISTVLAGEQLDTLHIVAHGQAGRWNFGGQWVDEAALARHAELVSTWQTDNIALWVCEAGQGVTTLETLARLTGAEVYAAQGHLGWDAAAERQLWELNHVLGTTVLRAGQVFDEKVIANWQYQLVSVAFAGIYATTASGSPDTFFGEETSSVTINTTPLATTNVTFSQDGTQFSGNNVLGTLTYGSTTIINALASRPIKSGGVVKGFYVWLDNDSSGAGTSGDTAFILSLDNSFFSSSAVGSSSDRVDSALNGLLPVNSAPVAVADVSNLALPAGDVGGPALEAGYNVATVNAVGNVLTNDTDTNAGDTKTVLKAGTSTADTSVTASTASSSGTDGTKIVGVYGDLYIGTDGNYRYEVDNTDSAVQALRTTSNTLSDTFSYQMKDAGGATSTTTLTVKIQGSNDAPVANIDYNTAKESITTPTATAGYSASGDVLANDSDVDNYTETKTVTGIGGSATGTASGGNTVLSFSTLPSNVSVGYYVFDGSPTLDSTTGTPVYASGTTTQLTITSIDTVNKTFTLSGSPATSFSANQILGFANNPAGAAYQEAQISSSTSGSSPTVNLSSVDGAVAVGMTVNGTGLATAPTVTAVTYDINGNVTSVTLSAPIEATATPLTFSAGTGTNIVGRFGTLSLASNGSYTYTPTQDNSYLSEGQSGVEEFNYTMRDAAGLTSSSQLRITVYGTGTNDPILTNDLADGSQGNLPAAVEGVDGTPGTDSIGSVLTNDNDNGGTNTVVAVRLAGATDSSVTASTTSINGTSITGLYGTLTIGADGTYKYVVDNTDDAVNALNNGDTLQESFVYTVENGLQLSDSSPAQSSATLTVVINGANDAPVAANDTADAVEAGGVNNTVAGVNPSGNVLGNDSDVDNAPAQFSVTQVGTATAGTAVSPSSTSSSNGTSVAGSFGSLVIGADGTWKYTVNQANVDASNLGPNSLQPLTDTFTYEVSDGSGGTDTATITVSIKGAADTVAVSNVYVNEASPYAVFSVTGVAGQSVSLELGNSTGLPASDNKATLGTDLSNALEYYDTTGTPVWKPYSTSVTIPTGGTLLVRVAINQDTTHEGNESFTLDVTTADGSSSRGIGTIGDEGDGAIFLPTNTTSTPNLSSDTGFPAQLDDDRDLSIAPIRVNEGSGYAVFEVKGQTGQLTQLALTAGTAAIASSGTPPTDGTQDFGPGLEYWNGTVWATYTANAYVAIPTGGKLLVRTTIVNDTLDEGDQTFKLTATNTGGTGFDGTATIDDHGGGVIYTFSGGTVGTSTTGLDDDRAIGVSSPTVNEASDWAVFNVTAVAGQSLTLSVVQGSGAGYAGLGASPALEYWDDGAGAWVSYNTSVTVPNGGVLLVRVNIQQEQDPSTPVNEPDETFVLRVGFNGANFDGTATIVDDGNGNIYPDSAPTDPATPVTVTTPTALDDDRALSIANIRVNEGSGHAVFEVIGAVNQWTQLALTAGTAAIVSSGTPPTDGTQDFGPGLEYWNGTTWTTYTANTYVQIPAGGKLLVRTVIVNDTADEGDQTFKLTATNTGGTGFDGTATIDDHGGGVIYTFSGGTVGTSNTGLNDDRLAPAPAPAPFTADLDPNTDTGAKDRITQDVNPEFTLNGGSYLQAGGTAKLLDPTGKVVGTSTITADDVKNGTINVAPGTLDDGVYTYTAQILDASGKVVASAPVTVTVVTDLDGVMPSVELAANGGDFNGDGVADWTQNNVAQLPLASLADYQAGKTAPDASFGAIMAGNVNAGNPGAAVQLDAGAQLINISLSPLPAPLPISVQAVTPTLNFSVMSEANSTLTDIDPTRAGLQTRVVIDLQPGGVRANTFLKWDADKGTWFDYLDDGDLSTLDDGATLLDTNSDGMIDRVVVTLTDGGVGDEDGVANGVIVDPGLLAFKDPAVVYSVLMANGDRYYTTDASEAAAKAKGTGNVFEGSRFDAIEGAAHRDVYYNPFTGDWFFAAAGQPMPYACYVRVDGAGFDANAAGQGDGQDYHLFINGKGITQLVTAQEAATLGLAAKGYADRGVLFNTTHENAFVFDAEAYLVANQGNADIQALVANLSKQFTKSSDAGFVEAVEQHYLNQVELVGLAHGGSATAADLNAAFGTHFLA